MSLLAPPVTEHRSGTFAGLGHPVGVIGTGMHVPDHVVTNADLTVALDTTDAWIRSRTGIEERRWLEPGRTSTDMSLAAARAALADSGVASADLGAVVVATFTGDQPLPSNALELQTALGATQAVPIDLNQAACAGAVLGTWLGAHLVAAPPHRPVLVVGVECLSRVTDPDDRTTRVFFGDAAGAVVLGPVAPGDGLLAWDLGSDLSHDVEIRAGGARRPTSADTVAAREHYLRMVGRTVWDVATRRLPESVRAVCDAAGVRPDDVDRFVLHQANLNIVHAAMDDLEQPRHKAAVSVDRLGNTGAATVFVGLHESRVAGHVGAGDLVVVSAIGAGFIWGSLVLRQQPRPRHDHPREEPLMTHDDAARLFVALYALDVDPSAIAPDEPLFGPRSAHGRDSMDVLRLIAALHERYAFDVGDLKTETFGSTAQIARFVRDHAEAKAGV